jgi:transcriptional regulator with PAS, ATPase and Fis domain
VAATNQLLEDEVEAGNFRDDLYYRLNVVPIYLPPLRERRLDIPNLARHFVQKHAILNRVGVPEIHQALMDRLLAYDWPGNVRELENTIQRAVILSDDPLIRIADLPADLVEETDDPAAVDSLDAAVMRFEKRHIQRILALYPDKKEAAKRLDMALSSLYRRISELGVAPEGK